MIFRMSIVISQHPLQAAAVGQLPCASRPWSDSHHSLILEPLPSLAHEELPAPRTTAANRWMHR